MHLSQLVQILGAVFVLVAFVTAQLKLLRPDSLLYLVANLAGSALLAAVALQQSQWGSYSSKGPGLWFRHTVCSGS